MIKLSDESAKNSLRGLFKHGALFHCKNFTFKESWAEPKDKFILVMRGWAADGRCHFYLPTSNLDGHKLKNSLYIIPIGSVKSFTDETGIIISSPHRWNYTNVERRYLNGTLEYCEEVDGTQMKQICEMIKGSDYLTGHQILALLSEAPQ